MEVVNARSALLSNFEVLALLRELESDHLAQTKTALRIKKEDEEAGRPASNYASAEQVSENLRTVEIEAIQYLTADYQPTSLQSDVGITNMLKGLEPFSLTKAEKLQIVNLAPTEPVELYVIVEEIEDRLGDQMNEALEIVQNSLAKTSVNTASATEIVGDEDVAYAPPDEDQERWDNDDEQVFNDAGEGAGVEGDLDMEDD